MKGKIETYYSYGNCFESTAEIFYPSDLESLKAIITFCRENQRTVTVAGTFNSFDQQNSGNDVVISLKNLNEISYDSSDHTMTVGAGAKWGDILDAAYANGCAVYNCVTGTQPSAGGTLSINSNSVWSSGNGKEATHCLSFEILTTEGDLLTCSRENNSALFFGAIAGMGMLGFITQITYQLHYVGQHYEIEIWVDDHDDIESLEQKFDLRKSPHFENLVCLKSQSSLFYLDGKTPKFGMYNRRYRLVEKKSTRSRLAFPASVAASGALRFFPSLSDRVLKSDAGRPTEKRRLLAGLNAVKPGMFWAEGDYYWSKYFGKRLKTIGYKALLYQNSYFIPFGDEKVTLFTKKVFELLNEHNLKTFMFDIMYIPQDEPFVLSCCRFSDGFYVNMTFMEKTNKAQLDLFYQKLNAYALKLGGRMNLSKNCYVDTDILAQMHGKEILEFMALKRTYDPSGMIQSNFFKTHFPSFCD